MSIFFSPRSIPWAYLWHSDYNNSHKRTGYMRKHAGTSQRLRQDQREKGMAAETNIEKESTTWPSRVAANYILSPYQDTWSVKSRSFCKLKSTVRQGLVQGSRVEMMSRRAKLVKDN